MRLIIAVAILINILSVTSALTAFGGELRLANRQIDTSIEPDMQETEAEVKPQDAFNAFSTLRRARPKYYLVQFEGPVQESWKSSLQALGVRLYDYVPDFGFLALVPDPGAVKNQPHVSWIGPYLPEDRIDPLAAAKVYAAAENSPPELLVQVFPERTPEQIGTEVTALGGTVINYGSDTLIVRIPAERLEDLSKIYGVKWIEATNEANFTINRASRITDVSGVRSREGLWGEGQIVAVADSGIDRGSTDPALLHPDFTDGQGNSRVLSIFDMLGDGREDISGHGTLVAGAILGNGIQSGSDPTNDFYPLTSHAGMAPKAEMVFQVVRFETAAWKNPDNLNALFTQAKNAGAFIHSNSWGVDSVGTYSTLSQEVDEFIWNNPEFSIVFAAGNEGYDNSRDGVIDPYSIGIPGSAKNCITVGASENRRPKDIESTYKAYANKLGSPFNSDHIADNPLGIAAYSSRGPTLDGRYKPDIVAPGGGVITTKSQAPEYVDRLESIWSGDSRWYSFGDGTSLATPFVSGAAALIREYFLKYEGLDSPSAALVKAALLNGAIDLSPGQYGEGRYREIPEGPVPDGVQGWGRLNLRGAIAPKAPFGVKYHDESIGLDTGESKVFTFNVSDSSMAFKTVLAWTDYPGSPLAQGGLVNDLDISVTDPDGAVHYADNAVKELDRGILYYSFGSLTAIEDSMVAVRCTPSWYPAHVDGIYLEIIPGHLGLPMHSDTGDADLVIYAENESTGLPGKELWRKKFHFFREEENVVGVTGVTIQGGDFFVAFEADGQHNLLGTGGNQLGRGLIRSGDSWVLSDYMPGMGARVSGMAYGNTYDRANNVVGITLEDPDPGVYSIKVKGYNVPQGPQRFALVTSGITGSLTEEHNIVGSDPHQDSPPTVVFTNRLKEALSAEEVESEFGLEVPAVLAELRDFNAKITSDPSGKGLIAFRYPVQGLGSRKVSEMQLLKFVSVV